jgi:cytochrome P450 family 4
MQYGASTYFPVNLTIKISFSDDSPRKAFLDSMIEFSENNNVWSEVELREEVDTMTIAGNDTTAQASCYVLTTLACLPHIQEKVVEE